METKWEIDDQNVVTVRRRPFSGKMIVTLNGAEVYAKRHLGSRARIPFSLADGRHAQVVMAPEALFVPRLELFVGPDLMVPSDAYAPKTCEKCSAAIKPNDKFCDGCGAPLLSGIDVRRQRRVKEAAKAIGALAILFAVFGVLMFFVQRATTTEALDRLAAMDPTAMIPVEGKTYTVAELRSEVLWEPWSVLAVNLVLSVVMGVLFFWGKKAPLPAMLAAAGTYLVVIVGSAMADPKTMAQGIIVKIIVITILAKGIRAALEMRTA